MVGNMYKMFYNLLMADRGMKNGLPVLSGLLKLEYVIRQAKADGILRFREMRKSPNPALNDVRGEVELSRGALDICLGGDGSFILHVPTDPAMDIAMLGADGTLHISVNGRKPRGREMEDLLVSLPETLEEMTMEVKRKIDELKVKSTEIPE